MNAQIYGMNTGTVKFYNQKSKFGFIVVDADEREIYVRKSGLVDVVEEGDRVECDIEAGKKGPEAMNVRKIQA